MNKDDIEMYEMKPGDSISKIMAAIKMGLHPDDVKIMDHMEKLISLWMDKDGQPLQSQMDNLALLAQTNFGHVIRHMADAYKSPLHMCVDAYKPEHIQELLDIQTEHLDESCPHGAACGSLLTIDVMIMNSRFPLWFTAKAYAADAVDYEIMRRDVTRWANLRAVTAEDGVQ